MPAPTTAISGTSSDDIPQHADPLHLQLDDVARLEPAPVSELQDATRADGARAEDVAWQEARVQRGMRDDPLPGEVHVAELPARAFLPVHARDHHSARAVEFV